MKNIDIDLEIKKVLLFELQGPDCSVSDVIDKILYQLMLLYSSHMQEHIIQIASQYVLAYLQLGFSYLEHKNVFDDVLQKAQFSQEQISALQMENPSVELNKTQLRTIIGRWAASSYNSHTITDAIDEIISHIEKEETGTYQYYTAKKDGSYTALYQLTVSSSYALFHDVFKNKYYRLIKK